MHTAARRRRRNAWHCGSCAVLLSAIRFSPLAAHDHHLEWGRHHRTARPRAPPGGARKVGAGSANALPAKLARRASAEASVEKLKSRDAVITTNEPMILALDAA